MSDTSTPSLIDSDNLKTLYLLQTVGGSVDDADGFASRRLFETWPEFMNGTQASRPLKTLEDYGLLVRDMKGKRTYRIELTDAGKRAAAQMSSIFQEIQTREPDNDQLIELLTQRLLNPEDHTDCETRISTLTQQLNLIRSHMQDLDVGEATWLDTFQNIQKVLNNE